jgi:hypothetical protein
MAMLACSEADEPSPTPPQQQQQGIRPQPLVQSPATDVQIRDLTRAEALAQLQDTAAFRIRGTRKGYLIEGVSGPLTEAANDASVTDALVGFLGDYGVLLMDPAAAAPAEPVTLRILGNPIPFRSGAEDGVYVPLSQVIDGAAVQDTLVGGRFVGRVLQKVSGRLYDPALSPTRSQQLACADITGTRTRFEQALAPSTMPASWAPALYVRFDPPAIFWQSGLNRLNAASCDWLPDLRPPEEDPASVFQNEVSP